MEANNNTHPHRCSFHLCPCAFRTFDELMDHGQTHCGQLSNNQAHQVAYSADPGAAMMTNPPLQQPSLRNENSRPIVVQQARPKPLDLKAQRFLQFGPTLAKEFQMFDPEQIVDGEKMDHAKLIQLLGAKDPESIAKLNSLWAAVPNGFFKLKTKEKFDLLPGPIQATVPSKKIDKSGHRVAVDRAYAKQILTGYYGAYELVPEERVDVFLLETGKMLAQWREWLKDRVGKRLSDHISKTSKTHKGQLLGIKTIKRLARINDEFNQAVIDAFAYDVYGSNIHTGPNSRQYLADEVKDLSRIKCTTNKNNADCIFKILVSAEVDGLKNTFRDLDNKKKASNKENNPPTLAPPTTSPTPNPNPTAPESSSVHEAFKKAEEEAAKRVREEEEEARKKDVREAEAKKKAEEEQARKEAEIAAAMERSLQAEARKKAEEEEAKKEAVREANARKEAEKAAAMERSLQAEARKEAEEEEAKKEAVREANARKEAEKAAKRIDSHKRKLLAKKRAAEEAAKKKQKATANAKANKPVNEATATKPKEKSKQTVGASTQEKDASASNEDEETYDGCVVHKNRFVDLFPMELTKAKAYYKTGTYNMSLLLRNSPHCKGKEGECNKHITELKGLIYYCKSCQDGYQDGESYQPSTWFCSACHSANNNVSKDNGKQSTRCSGRRKNRASK